MHGTTTFVNSTSNNTQERA